MRLPDIKANQRTIFRRSTCAVLRRGFLLAVLSGAILPAAAVGTEPAEEFLRGLKERGLNELALDYLERMKTSPLVGEEFRRQIPYHRGVVLIEQSRQSADPAVRSRLLDQARAELERFAQDNPDSVESAEAQMQLGTMQLDRGQQLMADARKLPDAAAYDAERIAQAREARRHYQDGRAMFELAAGIYSSELEKLPPTSSSDVDSDQGTKRQEYRSRVAQLRFYAAQANFETAQTFPPGDDDYRKHHESTAKELTAIYEEFARSTSALVALYAHLYEGRCYQALGEYQMALGCYEDILRESNVLPPFRRVIASAIHRKAETLTSQEKYDTAIEICRASLDDAQPDEQKLTEWLAVRFRLAEALQKKAEQLTAGSIQQRRLLAEARDAYRVVAGSTNEYQSAARAAVSALVPDEGEEREEPKSFQAAYDLGKDALASYNAARLAQPTAEKNNPEGVPELKTQMQQGKEDARHYFRLATTLIDDDTDPKLVNEVRYFLCWLYWEAEDYYRAAVLGEFIARRYPDHPSASSAAKLSMASFEQLYSKAAAAGGDNAATEFEARRMAGMAEFITRRWPGTDDADAAFNVLVSFAIRNDRIEEAEKLLGSASEQSRPRLALQLGNAMWIRYLELAHAKGADRLDEATLEKLKQSAVEYMRDGFESSRAGGNVSETVAAAGLYLVQALLSDEQYDDAIKLLEEKDFGPLALVNKGHSVASRPAFVVETYKAALRAYVLVSPPQDEKAVAAMKSLEKAVQTSGAKGDTASEQLTRIYVSLGIELQKQIMALRESGRGRQSERIAAAFAQFLDRIAARQTEADWPTRVWLAQTYYELGTAQRAATPPRGVPATARANSANSPIEPLSGAARDYLVKAREAYQKLLEAGAKNPELPPSDTSMLAARVQLGECERALGQYKDALDIFSAVLKEKESSLAVQRAAAYAYQERGQAEDAKWLEHAIHGGYRLRSTGENRIWGWLKISNVAARASRADQKYRDTFYEARLNVARCRYLAAMKQSGAARQRDLAKAKQSIQSFAQLYPEMGGERWRGEFQALLTQIEEAEKSD
jgi:tetratricopeptide (TPR) repeat protein